MQSSTTTPPESSVTTAPQKRGVLRSLGLGLITGAADDDPSALGTYASAGAAIGPGFLWTAPLTFPMMVAVVYLSSKLGQVSGEGLFAVLRKNYAKWIYYPALIGILAGNTIEAGADIGGMGSALHLLIPIPVPVILVATTAAILALQIWGSYTLIRDIFRWLALVLLAYVAAAFLAKPVWGPVLRGTFIPHIRFTKEFLSLLVAVIGTTMSAYLYTWQSNEEVEEKISLGKRYLWQRRGTTREALNSTKWDVISGMFFSNVVMYFVILATAATLFKAGHTDVNSAAEAAEALRPLAGDAAKWLFALGVVGVGFLAVPVMTTGAAYDLSQTMGWRHGLSKRPADAKLFYGAIVGFTLVALGMNFFRINPMKALVWAGVIQGFSTPPLLLLILLMTNNRKIMGQWVNSRATNVLGWATVAVIFAATLGLVVSWFV
jgi:NRAMP (natural resistance-associated macrophage protein)-like metal ion transporter